MHCETVRHMALERRTGKCSDADVTVCVFGLCGDANIAALKICLLSCVLHFHFQ